MPCVNVLHMLVLCQHTSIQYFSVSVYVKMKMCIKMTLPMCIYEHVCLNTHSKGLITELIVSLKHTVPASCFCAALFIC